MTTVFISLLVKDGSYGECVTEECPADGKQHDSLWTIERQTYDSGLVWPRIKVNREWALLEGSLPNRVKKLPLDAVKVEGDAFVRVWHEDNESHVFGGPNVAKALRESIAAHNKEATRG